ncbi:MAG TPA: hypothetical protein DCZ95_09890 [Verrucomicrobia bacterium]|nr:MAG: hypothetical protein A2X46_00110 [Lentisphaerae bacterium GWF2_57_35]HBA84391.1 hypothetical protein [Verrucomicrobiota bacterium]
MKRIAKTGAWMLAIWMGLAGALAWGSVEVNKVTCRVELDREVFPADTPHRAVVKVTLDAPPPPKYAEQRPPINLSIVLDRSGSMSGGKLENAKRAAIEALRRLGPRDYFALVVYDDQVQTLIPAQPAAKTEWMESQIHALHTGGGTALFGGVSQGAAEVRKHLDSGLINRIILLSDGQANVGPSQPSDLGRMGVALSKEGIAVTTVGVGAGYNEDLMTQLAQRSDGNTYFVENDADLPRIFAAELGDVLSVVAQKVLLTIECPEGARPVRIIGRDGLLRDNTVQIQLNQLYGGQEKFALIEVEVPAGRERDRREIAQARVEYDSVFSKQREAVTAEVYARFSHSEVEVSASGNKKVQMDVVGQQAAESKEQALELLEQGRREEAVNRLKDDRQRLSSYAAENALPAASLREAEELETDASSVQRGISSSERKDMKTKSYQRRNQQLNQ